MTSIDNASLGALCGLTFALGMRHGFDADHLAVIDGVTRLNIADRPQVARFSGALFSLGHGTVVTAGVFGLAKLSEQRSVPEWLEWTGAAVSITCLMALGFANLWAVWRTPATQPVALVGLRSRVVRQVRGPFAILAVGMMFALSFDTLSQAMLMAIGGTRQGGIGPAIAMALCFTAGMLTTDGANGLWMSSMMRSADRRAARASRAIGVAVGIGSLAVGLVTLAAVLSPNIAAWSDAYALWLAVGVVAAVAVAFVATSKSYRLDSAP